MLSKGHTYTIFRVGQSLCARIAVGDAIDHSHSITAASSARSATKQYPYCSEENDSSQASSAASSIAARSATAAASATNQNTEDEDDASSSDSSCLDDGNLKMPAKVMVKKEDDGILLVGGDKVAPNAFLREKVIAMVKRFPTHLSIAKGSGDDCCICTDKLKGRNSIIKYNCGHIIHESCFSKLIKIRALELDVICPECRAVVVPKNDRWKDFWMTKTRPWIRQRKLAIRKKAHTFTDDPQDFHAEVSHELPCVADHVVDSHPHANLCTYLPDNLTANAPINPPTPINNLPTTTAAEGGRVIAPPRAVTPNPDATEAVRGPPTDNIWAPMPGQQGRVWDPRELMMDAPE